MDATARCYESGVASDLSRPDLSLTNQIVGSFIAMANLQPGSSILDLGCGTAQK